MSAESKKKRGTSGVSNAKSISFRYHGEPKGYSLSTHIGGTMQFAGSKFLQAMILGARLPGFAPSGRMYNAADAAIDRIESRGYKVHKEKANA